MSSEPAIRAEGLGKVYELYDKPGDRLKQLLFGARRRYFREFRALHDASLEVGRGEIVGVMGRNGCGKSTLLQLISGTRVPTTGRSQVNGRLAAILGLGADFDPLSTGRENVLLSLAGQGLSRAQALERLPSILEFADIGDMIDRPVRTYSTGMTVRLAMAVAFSVEPDVVLIDEALAVGDELFQRRCFSRLEALRRKGGAILLVSHSSPLVSQLCDRVLLLDAGELIMTGPPRQVIPRYHQMIGAPKRSIPFLRAEIARLSRAGPAPVSGKERPARLDAEPPFFDPFLDSGTLVKSLPRGGSIEEVRLETPQGERVNVLRGRENYSLVIRTSFTQPADDVRFRVDILSATGVSLAVYVGKEVVVARVEPGAALRARLDFQCNLVPGIYFLDVIMRGTIDGEEKTLHRISDAAAFQVAPEKNDSSIGIVDMRFRMEIAPA